MPKQDTNQEAVRNVENITDSEPVNGEDLVESEDLKRKFRAASFARSIGIWFSSGTASD